jgi:hypothetical protein
LQRKTVSLWWKRWREEGTVQNHKSKGRQRVTTLAEDRRLVEDVLVRRFVSVPTYASELNVSQNTIRRRLKSAGLQHRIPAKKPILNDRHKGLRLAFANRYRNYDFEKVVFVDEKVFSTNEQGRVSLWRLENTRYEEPNILKTQQSGRLTLGFWGWMTSSGPGELIEIPTRMNSVNYKEILQEVLMPTAKTVLGGDEPITLIQDNSSVHNSRIVQTWIDEQEDLNLIKLPPKSPDMNPIENLWGLMIQNWNPTDIRNIQNLKDHVFELWDYYRGNNFCENCVLSMPDRLQAVIDADGSYTRF